MARLDTSSHFEAPDEFYAGLIAAQDGPSDEACLAFCARLILLLATHVGDREVLDEALAIARAGADQN